MKKYFIKESGEEVQFGDTIEMDFTKNMPNSKVRHYHIDCEFIKELLPIFLENEVIIEKEIGEENKDSIIDFGSPSSKIDNDSLEDRVTYLEGKVADLEEAFNTNVKNIAYLFSKIGSHV